ncbi:carboxymuconolactone decarboxylase family protein [Kribbella sp. CA-293567]|uniref:carboxymuconolactone decarboxylase family protein n=1 Tax=Kribbella sp. CA-293567 TaxID=3002436 RepID=UPI0022DDAE92|nr:carboxymuconolactone decarboxylase family protein [Kribbella sp. CA-293567]WBQ04365.1 carboxymuconolactone decarboxylase family protein [Kribbella sp. CA-293567]
MDPIEPPYEPRIADLLRKFMPADADIEPLALFRLFALHPDLADRIRPFASGLLNHGLLPARDREIVIARTTAVCGAEYEWGVHAVFFAGSSGLSRADYDLLAGDRTDGLAGPDRLLVTAVEELLDMATLSRPTRSKLVGRYSVAEVLELILLVGWYRSIATLVNATALPAEKWAAHFPANRLKGADL